MAELQKTLSFKVILLITINSIMGTGIFFLPAVGAAKSGPGSIISWVILAVLSIYIAMCFAELSSMYPKSGGIYEYCKQAYGSFLSFIIGWMTLIAGNITIAMLVVGAIRYLGPALPGVLKISISLFFIFIFNYMAYKGMKTSSIMLVTFGFITLFSILSLTFSNLIKFDVSNITPFFTHPSSAIFITIFFIAETFFGWETATFLAEETKNPRKTIPKALILGTVIIAIICLFFVVSSLGVLPWHVFGASKTPLAHLAMFHFGTAGTNIFTILVYLSIIGSVAGWIVSAPRLILALAEDKLFIPQCAQIHEVNKTPHKAILFQTILTSILVIVGSGSYDTLLELLLPLVLIIYSATLLSVVVLRFKKPLVERTYKVPLGKIGPILVAILCLGLIGYWMTNIEHAVSIFKIIISLIFFGVPIYFLLLFYYDPDAIIKINNLLSYFNLTFESLLMPKHVRKHMLGMFGDLRSKRVLEYGAGVGTMTVHIADVVGPRGKIYATELGDKNVRIIKKRLKKKGFDHVRVIHDEHQISRVHPDVKEVDIIFSTGMIGYMQDMKKILKEMNNLLPEGGKICFVEFVDFFWIIPNLGILSAEEKLKQLFRECGFSVQIEKKRRLFWSYLFVYGMKSKEDVPVI